MKVLLISASPINKTTSIGNTFLNIMPENIELSSIYTRSGLPDSRIKNAFCITEKMLIRFKKGRVIDERYMPLTEKEHDCVFDFAKKHRLSLFFVVREFIWRVFNWKTYELKKFIKDVNPDIIFSVSTNQVYLNRIISFITDYSGKPLMVYAWDNNYFDNPFEKNIVKKKMHKSEKIYMKKVLAQSEKVFVISPIQKMDYDREFSINSYVLTKYDDFAADFVYREIDDNYPVELVYTGNLGVNRYDTLLKISNALKLINENGTKAILRIYSDSPVTEEMRKSIDDKNNSFFMGSVSADLIPDIQKKAGILLHVEGFDEKSRFQIKYSFSTKIVDYLKSCRPILAVGPENVASIDYFLHYDSAVVASSEEVIYDKLKYLIDSAQARKDYAEKAYMCGKENHDKSDIEDRFYKLLSSMEV